MHKGDLINKISSKNTVASIKTMQVLNENSQVFFNFINSLHSDYTKASYKFCLEKFLNHYRIDLLSFLRLPQQDMTNLIIKYLVGKKRLHELYGGYCTSCGAWPSYKVSCDVGDANQGAWLVQRYCQACFTKWEDAKWKKKKN